MGKRCSGAWATKTTSCPAHHRFPIRPGLPPSPSPHASQDPSHFPMSVFSVTFPTHGWLSKLNKKDLQTHFPIPGHCLQLVKASPASPSSAPPAPDTTCFGESHLPRSPKCKPHQHLGPLPWPSNISLSSASPKQSQVSSPDFPPSQNPGPVWAPPAHPRAVLTTVLHFV
jgi:hypothetical protein